MGPRLGPQPRSRLPSRTIHSQPTRVPGSAIRQPRPGASAPAFPAPAASMRALPAAMHPRSITYLASQRRVHKLKKESSAHRRRWRFRAIDDGAAQDGMPRPALLHRLLGFQLAPAYVDGVWGWGVGVWGVCAGRFEGAQGDKMARGREMRGLTDSTAQQVLRTRSMAETVCPPLPLCSTSVAP